MSALAVETWPFDVREAASIIGLAEGSLVNLLARKPVFPPERGGSGRRYVFTMHDLMTLAVIKALGDFGLVQDDAVRLSPSTAGLYGIMKTDRPEVIHFARSGMTPRSDELVAVGVRLWAVWEAFYPKFREVLLSKPSQVSQEERARALRDYEAHMEEIRAKGPAQPARVWGSEGR